MNELSHIDKYGKARMVDVSSKKPMLRTAKATGFIRLSASTLQLVRENNLKKGDVISISEYAGIQGAKRTSDLIPLCHPLALSKIEVNARIEEGGIRINSMARCIGPTGVEMEALTAVQVSLLTVYDMCKAVDKSMRIEHVKLTGKTKEEIQ